MDTTPKTNGQVLPDYSDFTIPLPSPALVTPTSHNPVYSPFPDFPDMSDPYLHQYQLKQSPPADPQLSNSYPPPNIYYASESSNPYPANDRHRPNLTLPASTFTPDYNLPFTYPDQPLGQSPYHTPLQMNPNSGGSASSSTVMSEYFPPYPPPIQTQPYPLLSPVYQTPKNKVGGKTGRQQFSACGACRHRRVKCDLKEKQERESKSICSNCQERGIACM